MNQRQQRQQGQQQQNNAGISQGESICDFLYDLAWTIVLWIKVGQTSENSCQGPAWFWMNYGKIFYLVTTIMCFLSVVFCRPKFLEERTTFKVIAVFLFFVIKMALSFIGIAFSIGVIISFAHRDECDDLNGVIMALFIILMIGFGIIAIALCCACTAICAATGGDMKELVKALRASNNPVLKRYLTPPSYTTLLTRSSTSESDSKPAQTNQPNYEIASNNANQPDIGNEL